MEFECPKCETTHEITGEDIPECVCDSTTWECPSCGHETKIGWYAVIEER